MKVSQPVEAMGEASMSSKRSKVTMAVTAALAMASPGGAPSADPASAAKVSRPGDYKGYAQVLYDGVQRSSFYVTVRDGTKLAVDLFRPTRNGAPASEKLPVVWMHTPYNRRLFMGGPAVERYPGFAMELVKYGYNVAVVDFRGLYASFGRNRAYNRGEWLEPASTDAYDVTEWFARQPYSNGRIGMWGCSATGGSQMQAATTLPPSLKAIMPMSAEFDVYPFEVLGGVAGPGPVIPSGGTTKNANALRDAAAVPVDGPDGAALLAEAISQHKDNVESPGVLPFRDSRSDAVDADWWVKSSPSAYLPALKRSTFGVYAAANWEEAGTKPGAFFTFNNLPRSNTKLLIGPGTHCAWSEVKAKTGFSIVTEELRFFDYWLKGVDNGVMDEPRVTYFTYNASPASVWRSAKSWPLPNEQRTDFYLGKGALSTRKPRAAGADPTPMSPPAPATAIFISPQTGGLTYLTEPLKADLEVTGHPVMHLWIATDAGDADVLARIEDVAPDGTSQSYQMLGRLRASARAPATAPYDNLGLPWHSFKEADARPLPKDEPAELTFDLLPMSYIFKAGHRIGLQLTFADPKRRDGPAPTVTVRRGPETLSRLTLPVIPAGRAPAP
jgi:putative CocE/NonD family hydrolase